MFPAELCWLLDENYDLEWRLSTLCYDDKCPPTCMRLPPQNNIAVTTPCSAVRKRRTLPGSFSLRFCPLFSGGQAAETKCVSPVVVCLSHWRT